MARKLQLGCLEFAINISSHSFTFRDGDQAKICLTLKRDLKGSASHCPAMLLLLFGI